MEDEQTIFRKAVGDSPKIRVLEFLIEGRDLDYSISDIAEGAGIGRTTLFRIWNDLDEMKIVKHTRNIGNARLYKINQENNFVKKLMEVFETIVIEPLAYEEVKIQQKKKKMLTH